MAKVLVIGASRGIGLETVKTATPGTINWTGNAMRQIEDELTEGPYPRTRAGLDRPWLLRAGSGAG
jgi:NAD(P)-dependent dehydrogenase (short-subunit alcohol dehydrogenase family)